MADTDLLLNSNPEMRTDALERGMSDINQKFKEREVFEHSKKIGMTYINLLETAVNPDVFNIIPKDVSLEASIVPFYHLGRKLKVAYPNPQDAKTKKAVQVLGQKFEVEEFICSPESLAFVQENYNRMSYFEEEEIRAIVDEDKEVNLKEVLAIAKKLPERMLKEKTDMALNMLHEVVLQLRVSDIHFQPEEERTKIRARVDGMLQEICSLTHGLAQDLVQQIKHDSHLKYNVTNIPQDGKYSFLASDRSIDVRVSVFPTSYGESVVLRFLDGKKGIVPFEKLGFSEHIRIKLEKHIHNTGGMCLVTGPTGSGKTTTLYSSIDKVNTPEKKIATLEDPVEFRLKGVLQSGIDHSVGFDFARGLRSMLRQDPDIILIGEIRDQETAEAAVQSALTGHVVFSTLHTNSSADAIPRLINMGLPAFILAPALRMVAAQRLVRTICEQCKKTRPMTDYEKGEIGPVFTQFRKAGLDIPFPEHLFEGAGCDRCCGTGFRGETAVLEMLEVNDDIQALMFSDFSAQSIKNTAREQGMLTMWEEGIFKIVHGITTLDELKRKVEKSV
jgi:type II secretory ATPase GspE/PulE/Tfp pilus assembly ATPase PilB-like protein